MNSDHHLRDFRRMTGGINIMQNGKPVPGPYTQESREEWLKRLLQAQSHIRKHGPQDVRDIELLTMEELQEIRRIWVVDKHELEDTLPKIYKEATGQNYPGAVLDDDLVLGASEMTHLSEICDGDRLHYELSRELLSLTRQQRNSARRAGLFDKFEKSFSKHFFDDQQDAVQRAQSIVKQRDKLREQKDSPLGALRQETSSPNDFNSDQI
jgi:DNA sulfur modification protein DndC